MGDREKVINGLRDIGGFIAGRIGFEQAKNFLRTIDEAIVMLKEQEAKQYNSHDVACILADLFGDPCACNFNDIDTWLPYKCDFRETCCPNPVGVACWEQYLKHKEGR